MGCLGWLFVFAGMAAFFVSFGLATPVAVVFILLGLVFIVAGGGRRANRNARDLTEEVGALREEVARLRDRGGR